jgi:hypothetical protein
MLTFRLMGSVAIAAIFAMALAIDAADARRGGGGGMRAGGFGGGGMRAGGGGMRVGGGGGMRVGGGGGRFANVGGARPSHPIARPPGMGNRPGQGPGWGNRPGTRPPGWAGRPGYNPGWGYRPGWGAAAAAATVGAGLAASSYYDPYYGYGYSDPGYVDPGYAAQSDPIAECARRFKTYDPASQTYVVRKGVRASCP